MNKRNYLAEQDQNTQFFNKSNYDYALQPKMSEMEIETQIEMEQVRVASPRRFKKRRQSFQLSESLKSRPGWLNPRSNGSQSRLNLQNKSKV